MTLLRGALPCCGDFALPQKNHITLPRKASLPCCVGSTMRWGLYHASGNLVIVQQIAIIVLRGTQLHNSPPFAISFPETMPETFSLVILNVMR